MRLFRAVDDLEFADIVKTGQLHPAPPSNQGKWLAETVVLAVSWGQMLYPSPKSFRVIEVEVDDNLANSWYRDAFLDWIGPARYAEIPDLPQVRVIGPVFQSP